MKHNSSLNQPSNLKIIIRLKSLFFNIKVSSSVLRVFYTAIVSGLIVAFVTGCATNPSLEVPSKSSVVSEKPPPNVVLNKSLLEKLLLDRFAVYYSQWQQSLESSFQVAKSTNDWRMAKRAAEIGFTLAKDYEITHQAALLWKQLQPNSPQAQLYYVASGVGLSVAGVDRIDLHKNGLVDSAINYVTQHPKGELEALSILSQYMRTQPNLAATVLLQGMEASFLNSADFMYEATLVHAWFKQDAQAREYLRKAFEAKPDHQKSIVFKYQLLSIEQGKEAANLYLREQIARFPGSKKLRNQHLNNLYINQQYAEVVSLTDSSFSNALGSDNKDDAAAWYFRGASFVQLNKLKEAETALTEVLQINPNDDETRLQLGRVYFANERYSKALEVLGQIKAFDSQYGAGILQAKAMTKAYPDDLGVNRALRKLNGLRANTKSKIIERALTQSQILSDSNQPLRAMGYLTDALAAYQENESLLYARGLIASEIGELAVAEVDLGKVIQLKPNNATALNALGYTLLELTERYDEAQVLIERALKIEPESQYILDSAGWVAYKKGDLLTALQYLQRAYEIDDHPEVAAHFGEVLYKSGQITEARAIWQKSLLEHPDNDVLNTIINQFK